MNRTINSTARLNNGVEIPWIGLGVFRSHAGEETQQAVRWALEAGYRHIDTARIYGNEHDVGAAIRSSGIPRQEIFVTTKLWNEDHGYRRALQAVDESLHRLGLDYIDLYLIHWPVEGLRLETWQAMEAILKAGKARAVGVSNYMLRHMQELLDNCEVLPAVNQIELSPFNFQSRADLVALCRERGVALEAYSPLTKAAKLQDPVVRSIAAQHGKSPAQVLIRYAIDKDVVVLPKSSHRERIRENANVFDFQLTPENLATLDALNEGLITGWDPTNAP